MKQEKRTILDFIRSLFRKESVSLREMETVPTAETVERLVKRTVSDEPGNALDSDGSGGDGHPDGSDADTGDADDNAGGGEESKKRESCPYATRRAIVESIAEIRRFAEEHKLAASVVRSLLTLLAEIALGALKGKVSREILELLLRAINYELAVEEAFRNGHLDGRKKLMEERYPAEDDGLPHINGPYHRPDTTSIFDVAAEARR